MTDSVSRESRSDPNTRSRATSERNGPEPGRIRRREGMYVREKTRECESYREGRRDGERKRGRQRRRGRGTMEERRRKKKAIG